MLKTVKKNSHRQMKRNTQIQIEPTWTQSYTTYQIFSAVLQC